MDSLSYKTISANASTVTKEWVVIDATNEVLGRLASQIAKILRGKNKPSYATPADYLAKKPTFLIEKAVKGMLPKTRLGDRLLMNLKVYAGAEHPHAAQNPKTIKLNEIK